jgi:hypothetical protein
MVSQGTFGNRFTLPHSSAEVYSMQLPPAFVILPADLGAA